LCGCKFEGGKNIVQLAKKGDWVIGTGGASKRSAGYGKLIYAMRVDRKIPRWEYFNDSRFERKKPTKTGTCSQTRGDNQDPRKDGRNAFWREAPRLSDRKYMQFVLISRHFWYFGVEAIPLPEEFKGAKPRGFKLEKKGPGFRSNFAPEDVRRVIDWLEGCRPGVRGEPCGQAADEGRESSRWKSSC
jgi:hypothetical protein